MVKSSGEMVKWCNNKHLHLIMVKWFNNYGEMVKRIQTSSYGEIVKQSNGYILFTKRLNGDMVILAFVSPLFHIPLRWWRMSPLLDSIRCCIHHLCISHLWYVPHCLSNFATILTNFLLFCIPLLLLINTFILFLPSATTNTGGWGPFCNVLLLYIACCSYTGDIVYFLCVNITYI